MLCTEGHKVQVPYNIGNLIISFYKYHYESGDIYENDLQTFCLVKGLNLAKFKKALDFLNTPNEAMDFFQGEDTLPFEERFASTMQNPEDEYIRKCDGESLYKALDSLSPKKREIVARHAGLGKGEEESFSQIAEKTGFGTRQRVCQLNSEAMAELRQSEYLDFAA